jgi:hypothetical protein
MKRKQVVSSLFLELFFTFLSDLLSFVCLFIVFLIRNENDFCFRKDELKIRY